MNKYQQLKKRWSELRKERKFYEADQVKKMILKVRRVNKLTGVIY